MKGWQGYQRLVLSGSVSCARLTGSRAQGESARLEYSWVPSSALHHASTACFYVEYSRVSCRRWLCLLS